LTAGGVVRTMKSVIEASPHREEGEETQVLRPPWGPWESAATTLLFSVPALLLLVSVHRRSGWGPDAFDWALLGTTFAGAFAVTLAGRGLRTARAFLSTGLFACCFWGFAGWFLAARDERLLRLYLPFVLAVLGAECHLVPVSLLFAGRRLEKASDHEVRRPATGSGRRPELVKGRRAFGRHLTGAFSSLGLLDVSPIVYLLSAALGWGAWPLFVWMAVWAGSLGVFATLATGVLAAARPPAGPKAPPPEAGQLRRGEGPPRTSASSVEPGASSSPETGRR
jgi:hypothetical protein